MKKKLISVLAVIVLLTICVTALVACNHYEWNSIGGGDSRAASESNGGTIVKQGNYAYFINGYVGADADNTWGNVIKGAIVRADLDEKGAIKTGTEKVVVPKNVYNSSVNGGIAVFGEWIYYATPNNEKDKNGTASTTDTDFMRTKIDGSVTQRIGTIGTRSAEYIFTPSRVLYYTNNTISYIDFSGMKTNKSIDNGKGAYSGTLAENVSSVVWEYDAKYEGAGVADYIFYTQTITGDDSFKSYNNFYAVKYDGSDSRLLATETTYLAEGEEAVENPQKVYKFSLVDLYLEDDVTATIYYTKTYHKEGKDETVGLFCNKFDAKDGFKAENEKKLNTLGTTTMFALGYEDGALAFNNDSVYCWYNGQNASDPIKVTEASQKVWFVKDGYAYVTKSSSATELFKIKYKELGNVKTIVKEGMKVDWLAVECIGDNLYFFASDDKNYMHTVNIETFDYAAEDAESTFVGIMLDADKPVEDEEE